MYAVWSSTGLWAVDWVGLWVHSFHFAMGWVSRLVGWVEEIGPTDNSAQNPSYRLALRYHHHCLLFYFIVAVVLALKSLNATSCHCIRLMYVEQFASGPPST